MVNEHLSRHDRFSFAAELLYTSSSRRFEGGYAGERVCKDGVFVWLVH